MSKHFKLLAAGLLVALGAAMAISRPALANSGCAWDPDKHCMTLDAGDLCTNGVCEPIIINLSGKKLDE
jgi:hypothetical protein